MNLQHEYHGMHNNVLSAWATDMFHVSCVTQHEMPVPPTVCIHAGAKWNMNGMEHQINTDSGSTICYTAWYTGVQTNTDSWFKNLNQLLLMNL